MGLHENTAWVLFTNGTVSYLLYAGSRQDALLNHLLEQDKRKDMTPVSKSRIFHLFCGGVYRSRHLELARPARTHNPLVFGLLGWVSRV